MQYCTYEFYSDEYGGTLLTESEWKKHEIIAAAAVDKATFGRMKKAGFASADDVPEEIKLAICSVAECSVRAEMHGGHTVASETTGKHSVTYADSDVSTESAMRRAAMQFLSGSRWTYRGLYPDERPRHHHHYQCR